MSIRAAGRYIPPFFFYPSFWAVHLPTAEVTTRKADGWREAQTGPFIGLRSSLLVALRRSDERGDMLSTVSHSREVPHNLRLPIIPGLAGRGPVPPATSSRLLELRGFSLPVTLSPWRPFLTIGTAGCIHSHASIHCFLMLCGLLPRLPHVRVVGPPFV